MKISSDGFRIENRIRIETPNRFKSHKMSDLTAVDQFCFFTENSQIHVPIGR